MRSTNAHGLDVYGRTWPCTSSRKTKLVVFHGLISQTFAKVAAPPYQLQAVLGSREWLSPAASPTASEVVEVFPLDGADVFTSPLPKLLQTYAAHALSQLCAHRQSPPPASPTPQGGECHVRVAHYELCCPTANKNATLCQEMLHKNE